MRSSAKGADPKKDAAPKDSSSKPARPARASLTGSKTTTPSGAAATVTVRRVSKDVAAKTGSVTSPAKAPASPGKPASPGGARVSSSSLTSSTSKLATGSRAGVAARPGSREAATKRGAAASKAATANGAAAPAPTRPATAAPAESRRVAEAAVAPEVVKPDNQLQLTETELKEDIAKMLTTGIPDAPKAAVRYLYREHAWRPEQVNIADSVMMHYSCDGWLLHQTLDEARRHERTRTQQAASAAAAVAAYSAANRGVEGEESQASTGDGARDGPSVRTAGVDTAAEDQSNQVLRNQFNFSERGAQTAAYPPRERGTSTEPLPVTTVGGSTSQWVAYDAYAADQERQRTQEEAGKAKAGAKGAAAAGPRGDETPRDVPDASAGLEAEQDANVLHTPAMGAAAKVLERMSSQISQLEISMDFKYWDDVADAYRQDEGTLLPLWKFQTERARRKQVTAIAWNPEYPDLFATGFGSFDYHKQGGGLVACFSLKNPGNPEYHVHLPSGVMSLDWHPQHTSLMAVGCYDGSVKVYDMRVRRTTPLYTSIPGNGQHRAPVWGVRWSDAETAKARVFLSLSADGRIVMWSLVKDKLQYQDVMQLTPPADTAGKADTGRSILSAGTCFDFHKAMDHLFLVGTEEGVVHKCSTAYSAEYLASFQGHDMATYATRWNHKHARSFLSASADWTVKLWDDSVPQAVMSFDLASPVGDVAWAPFSSTVFAAATEDGKVHVYDLSQDTSAPLCEQLVVKAANLTRISFNPKHPVLLVGDNKGFITSFKLSPNLRKAVPPPKPKPGAAAAPAPSAPGGPTPEQLAAQAAAAFEASRLDAIMELALKGRVGLQAKEP